VPPSEFGINELVPTLKRPQPQAHPKASLQKRLSKKNAAKKYFLKDFMKISGRGKWSFYKFFKPI
jgi:hypothetical protein